MMTVWVLFLANLKMILRNRSGFFWTILMPVGLYVALSILPVDVVKNGNHAYSNYLLPGVIAMTIMQGGIYSLAYWMVDLKSRGVIKRLRVTPLSKSRLIISVLLARTAVMIFQVILLTVVGTVFFHATFSGWSGIILTLTLLGGFIFLLFGLLISVFADTYESAAPLTAALGLPLAFLGNIFFPSESLPEILQKISGVLPITFLSNGLRSVYFNTFTWQTITRDLSFLLIWLLVVFVITVSLFRFEE